MYLKVSKFEFASNFLFLATADCVEYRNIRVTDESIQCSRMYPPSTVYGLRSTVYGLRSRVYGSRCKITKVQEGHELLVFGRAVAKARKCPNWKFPMNRNPNIVKSSRGDEFG